MDLKTRLEAVMKNVKELQAKGTLSPEEIKQIDKLLAETEALKEQQASDAQAEAQEKMQRIQVITEEMTSQSRGRQIQESPNDQNPAVLNQPTQNGRSHNKFHTVFEKVVAYGDCLVSLAKLIYHVINLYMDFNC